MTYVDDLLAAYRSFVALPWEQNLAGKSWLSGNRVSGPAACGSPTRIPSETRILKMSIEFMTAASSSNAPTDSRVFGRIPRTMR